MLHKDLPSNAIEVLLQLVGAKWKFLIIQELLKKEMRFSELKKKLGCTSKVLTSCLKELETDGLLVREEETINNTKRIEYYLTDIGFTLRPVIQSMNSWGKDYKKLIKLMERV
jgi:DNA-binding HxlR family transcriptional regulator